MLERLKRRDVEVIELKKKPGPNWHLPHRLARLFRSIRPDIVHTRNWGTVDGILAARLSCIPRVVHGEHGRTIFEVETQSRRRRWVRRSFAPFVTQFIAVSQELREWMQRANGIDGSRVRVIYNGVDTAKFFRASDKPSAKGEICFSNGPVLGTVGRLDPVKNQAILIEAVAALVKLFPKLKLVIVGSGPCQQQLEELVQGFNLSEHVCLVGERDDIPDLLRSLDIFLLPSVSEGISNTILEAMACELPVVACDVGGNGELIIPRETGQLVPARDVDAFRRAVQEYLTAPGLRHAHGMAARRRVEQLFSLDRMVSAYDATYCEMVGDV
jgi:sugar transferase (PEP-CTERM/EpsH1 system associated)